MLKTTDTKKAVTRIGNKRRIGLGWSVLEDVTHREADVGAERLCNVVLKVKRFQSVRSSSHEIWIKGTNAIKFLERKLCSVQRGTEELMLGVTEIDSNNWKWIREQTKAADVIKTVKINQWQIRTYVGEGTADEPKE